MSAISGTSEAFESTVAPHYGGLVRRLTAVLRDPEAGRREHRGALLLSAVDGYTQAGIAAMLEVPPGTVASWLSRAKAQLREALRDD